MFRLHPNVPATLEVPAICVFLSRAVGRTENANIPAPASRRGWDYPGENQGMKAESGRGELEGIEHVAGEQSKNGHYQNCFQLFVVRGIGAAEVIAGGPLRVILNGQPFAYRVRGDVLGPVMTKISVVHPAVCQIAEPYLVVAGDASQVIVKSYPLTRVHGCVRGGPGFGRRQFPK